MSKPWLYPVSIFHAREGAAANAFRYPGLYLCFPLAERARLASRLFGFNRFNLFGYCDRDHGNGGDPEAWVRQVLAEHGAQQVDGEILLMTMPRVLGFVFNPVSFWYCHDCRGGLRAVLCEVNNTFGERHCYIVQRPDQGVIDADTELHCAKVFHVSPFYGVAGSYRFRFPYAGAHRRVAIQYYHDDVLQLRTSIDGKALELSDRALISAFMRLGWSTVMVVLRIHWQALKLWLKGASFHSKPEPPQQEISS